MLQAPKAIFPVVSGNNGDGRDISAGISGIPGGKAVVGAVAEIMLNSVAGGAGEDHLPSPPGVAAPPQCGIRSVDHLRVHRIEGESSDPLAEIEHVPRPAIVACDVIVGHVAVLNHNPGIVGADRWVIRGAAAAGAEYFPTFCIRPLSEAEKREESQHDCKN